MVRLLGALGLFAPVAAVLLVAFAISGGAPQDQVETAWIAGGALVGVALVAAIV